MRALLAVLVVAGASGCGSCEPQSSSGSSGASPHPTFIVSAVAPHPSASTSASQLPHGPPTQRLACRVVTMDGDARIESPTTDAGAPLLLQGLTPTETWFDVARGGRVVAKDPKTGRETTFRGPARVRACVGYAEESWLASGRFESTVGAGESPGAEEWVATPYGVVRYTAAKMSVDVGARDADVTLEGGQAFAWGGPTDAGTADEGWTRLSPGKSKLTMRDAPAAAVDRCAKLAEAARALAAKVMAPEGGVDGGTILEQVTTRRLARAACAVASVRTNALAPADAAPLLHPLADANAAWSTLP